MSIINQALLLAEENGVYSDVQYTLFRVGRIALIALITLASIVAIVCVLMQESNSDGVQAISGSSETFFSKNKGRSKESVLRIITTVCLICIAVFAIGFFLLDLLVK